MPPRLRTLVVSHSQARAAQLYRSRHFASVAAVAPSQPLDPSLESPAPIERYHPKQPPSFKPPDLRKSQLLRQYTSLLRSSPLLLIFQHNSLLAHEWAALRRELKFALEKTTSQESESTVGAIRLSVVRTSLMSTALRLVEFYQPPDPSQASYVHASEQQQHTPDHYLSKAAYESTVDPTNRQIKKSTPLHNLLNGPVAVVSFSDVTPEHLAAVLSVLAPTQGARSAFPPPKRKTNPTYYEPAVQIALQKLLLLGARVEERMEAGVMKSRNLDEQGIRWVGGLKGGLDGMRAQLVNSLQSAGMGLTSTLEGASRNLWMTMEGRKMAMEEDTKEAESK